GDGTRIEVGARVSGSPPSRAGVLVAGIVFGGAVAAGMVMAAFALLGPADAPSAAGPPEFTEETVGSGVDHVYDGEFAFFVGGGVAVFDCDGDGRQELFLAGGENPAALFRNQSDIGGELRFAPLADDAISLTGVTGAYPV